VQNVFGSEEGQYVLSWLEELHVRHKTQHLIASNHSNLAGLLCYKAGKADLVIELRDVFERGFERADQPITEEED